jgi:hypothetical protein
VPYDPTRHNGTLRDGKARRPRTNLRSPTRRPSRSTDRGCHCARATPADRRPDTIVPSCGALRLIRRLPVAGCGPPHSGGQQPGQQHHDDDARAFSLGMANPLCPHRRSPPTRVGPREPGRPQCPHRRAHDQGDGRSLDRGVGLPGGPRLPRSRPRLLGAPLGVDRVEEAPRLGSGHKATPGRAGPVRASVDALDCPPAAVSRAGRRSCWRSRGRP